MSDAIDLDAMFKDMDAAADRAEKTLDGKFGGIYRDLRRLSPEDLEDITPDATHQKEYERLMALVQNATETNMSQAELGNRVRDLGDTAVRIAQKVPSLASLL